MVNFKARRQLKASDANEMQFELGHPFFCGCCNQGMGSEEDYRNHNESEDHNYHIARRIVQMVPGLGFCPACSCIIQTTIGWEAHIKTDKHTICIRSLNAIGIYGDFNKPLGCQQIGMLGPPIDASEIDHNVSNSYGHGHGGVIAKGTPIIGLNYVARAKKDIYHCTICYENFWFEHRSKHVCGPTHRLNYMKQFHVHYYQEVMNIPEDFRIRRRNKIAYLARKIEDEELSKETENSKEMRKKFLASAEEVAKIVLRRKASQISLGNKPDKPHPSSTMPKFVPAKVPQIECIPSTSKTAQAVTSPTKQEDKRPKVEKKSLPIFRKKKREEKYIGLPDPPNPSKRMKNEPPLRSFFLAPPRERPPFKDPISILTSSKPKQMSPPKPPTLYDFAAMPQVEEFGSRDRFDPYAEEDRKKTTAVKAVEYLKKFALQQAAEEISGQINHMKTSILSGKDPGASIEELKRCLEGKPRSLKLAPDGYQGDPDGSSLYEPRHGLMKDFHPYVRHAGPISHGNYGPPQPYDYSYEDYRPCYGPNPPRPRYRPEIPPRVLMRPRGPGGPPLRREWVPPLPPIRPRISTLPKGFDIY